MLQGRLPSTQMLRLFPATPNMDPDLAQDLSVKPLDEKGR